MPVDLSATRGSTIMSAYDDESLADMFANMLYVHLRQMSVLSPISYGAAFTLLLGGDHDSPLTDDDIRSMAEGYFGDARANYLRKGGVAPQPIDLRREALHW